jgi:hypothetical protein
MCSSSFRGQTAEDSVAKWSMGAPTARAKGGPWIRPGRAHNSLFPLFEGMFMAGVNFTSLGAYDRALAGLPVICVSV